MAKKYLTLITTKGKQKIMNATATGRKVSIKKIKLGDGNGSTYSIDENQTELKKVVYETNITSYTVDPLNTNTIYIESLIPSNVGGFYIREIGLFDDEDDLIVISSYEETYKPIAAEGSTMELYIRTALILSNMNSIQVLVDPSIVMATKKDLQKIIKLIGDLGTASNNFSNTNSVLEMLLELKGDFEKIDLLDTKIYITDSDGSKTSKNLKTYLKDTLGILGNLNTLNKTNLVTAINEVLGKTSTNASEIQKNKEKLNIHQQHLESLDNKLTSNNALFSEYNRRFRELNGGE